jgi:hypothetical protein
MAYAQSHYRQHPEDGGNYAELGVVDEKVEIRMLDEILPSWGLK